MMSRGIIKRLLTVWLMAMVAGTPAIAFDDSVFRLQRALTLAGYNAGAADGVWGTETARAAATAAIDAGLSPPSDPGDAANLAPHLTLRFNQLAEEREHSAAHLQVVMTERDAIHLLERAGIGANPQEVAALVGLTRSQAISWVIAGLDPSPLAVPLPASLVDAPYPAYWIRWDYDRAERDDFGARRDREMANLRLWWVRMMIATRHPQQERLLLLWHNHFVTAYSGVDHNVHSILAQDQMLRRLGCTNLRSLLHAVLRDPAMLNYLDNDHSLPARPNENLARELLELFVLGGGYGEGTVREVARALTGYRTNALRQQEFQFAEWAHDQGDKTVLGVTGDLDADTVIDILLAQPQTAEFIAAKFWRAYVSEFFDDPTERMAIAAEFRNSGYEIKVLLRQTLASRAFWSDDIRYTIVKSPVDLVIGAIRSSRVVPGWWPGIPAVLASLGQDLFNPPNVAGWPGGEDWIGTARLLDRRNVIDDVRQAAQMPMFQFAVARRPHTPSGPVSDVDATRRTAQNQLTDQPPTESLTAERVSFEWADAVSPNDEWITLALGLLAPRFGAIQPDAIRLKIVRQITSKGARVMLELSGDDCFPDCFWSPHSGQTAELSVPNRFILTGWETAADIAAWNELRLSQKRFVATLWMAVPSLLASARTGRNWSERGGSAATAMWRDILDTIDHTLPSSRYAALAAPEPFRLSPAETPPIAASVPFIPPLVAGQQAATVQVAGYSMPPPDDPAWHLK